MARNSLKAVMRLIDNAKDELPVEKAFLEDLKRSIEINEEAHVRKPSQTYKPSSMHCIRNMFYQVTGKDVDTSAPSYMMTGIVNAGSDIHTRIQEAVLRMKDAGFDCEYVDVEQYVKKNKLKHLTVREKHGAETKLFNKGLNMSFMCDGIILYQGEYYVLEIKSETAYKWYDRKDVDPKHHNQAIAYAEAFGLDKVIFLYVSRDMLDMKAYMFHVTDDMKESLIGLIEECDGYVKRLVTPPKPADIARKTCEYCNYKTQCRKDGK